MKTNQKENYSYRLTLTPLFKYVSMRSLAVAMFVAVALLGTTRGNETERFAKTSESYAGSLEVYSATDEFNDGGSLYYAHSSYAIYGFDGKFYKTVENHISRSDELPETVSLPAGAYTIVARSEKSGYVRIPVLIKEGRRTILDLDV